MHDPVLSYQHGRALARLLSNARLITLDGAGHELHPIHFGVIADAVASLAG